MEPGVQTQRGPSALTQATVTPSRDAAVETQSKRYHPAVHFAFVSGILLPLTILPWYLSKRHTANLRVRLQQAERRFEDVRLDLRTALLEMDMERTQRTQLIANVKEISKEVEGLKAALEKTQTRVDTTQRLLRNELRDETKAVRDAQSEAFRSVGQSLETVAGFMHELEVQLGLERRGQDQRGIEQHRRRAVRLGNGADGQRP